MRCVNPIVRALGVGLLCALAVLTGPASLSDFDGFLHGAVAGGDDHLDCAGWSSALERGHGQHDESRFELAHRSHHRHHGMLSPSTATAALDVSHVDAADMPPVVLPALEPTSSARSADISRQRGRAPPTC